MAQVAKTFGKSGIGQSKEPLTGIQTRPAFLKNARENHESIHCGEFADNKARRLQPTLAVLLFLLYYISLYLTTLCCPP